MNKFVAALAAVFTLATAGVASAQDWGDRDRDRGEWRGDRDDRGRDEWRGDRGGDRGQIVIRDLRGRTHTFGRRDREFDTLVRSPFGMRPGLTYVYTNDCRRGECQVYIYEGGRRRPVGQLWAPTLNDQRYFGYSRGDDRRRPLGGTPHY